VKRRPRIIDCHAHLGQYRHFPIPLREPERMIAAMDRAGVEAACLSSLTALGADTRLGNTQLIAAAAAFPARLLGWAVPNPHRPAEIAAELERCFRSPWMRGIKLHPMFHAYPAEGANYTPVYEFAQARGLPILNHDWGAAGFLEKLARRYPQARFIQAHTGGWWNGRSEEPYLELARSQPNVYLDTAASIAYYGAFEKLVEAVGADKLLFGSDFPYLDLGYQLGRVLLSSIGEREKRKILGGNAAALFGLG